MARCLIQLIPIGMQIALSGLIQQIINVFKDTEEITVQLIGLWTISLKRWIIIIQANICKQWLRYLFWYCSQVIVFWFHRWSVYAVSGNGLKSSGKKPLPEPMFT